MSQKSAGNLNAAAIWSQNYEENEKEIEKLMDLLDNVVLPR